MEVHEDDLMILPDRERWFRERGKEGKRKMRRKMDEGKRGEEERRSRKGWIVREKRRETKEIQEGLWRETLSQTVKGWKEDEKGIKITSCFVLCFTRCRDGQRKWQVPLPPTLSCQRGSRRCLFGITVSLLRRMQRRCCSEMSFTSLMKIQGVGVKLLNTGLQLRTIFNHLVYQMSKKSWKAEVMSHILEDQLFFFSSIDFSRRNTRKSLVITL